MRSINFISLLTFISTIFVTAVVSLPSLAWNTPQTSSLGTVYQPWTWTGAGGDANWSNGNNWCGSYLNGACRRQLSAPPTNAVVVFNAVCQAYSNCNVNLPAGTVTLKGLILGADYAGTITQGATNLEIGATGFYQYGGTFNQGTGSILVQNGTLGSNWIMTGGVFNGGSGNITVAPTANANAALFRLAGGSFTSTSGVLRLMIQTVDFNGVSFNHHGGTVEFEPTVTAMDLYPSPTVVLHHVRYTGYGNRSIRLTPSSSAELKIDGDLTFNPTPSSLQALGGAIVVSEGNVFHTGEAMYGNTTVKLTGASRQDIDSTGAADKAFPGLELAHPTNTGSGRFVGDIKLTGGFETATTAGTFDLNNAAVTFSSYSVFANYNTTFIEFPTLTITGRADRLTFGTVRVAGDVYLNPDTSAVQSSNSTGLIYVGGNLVVQGANYFAHRATFELNGGAPQLVQFTDGARTVPSLRFNNSSGGVTFSESDVTFSGDIRRVAGAVTLPTSAKLAYSINSIVGMGSVLFTNVEFAKDSAINLESDMTISGNLNISNTTATYCNGAFTIRLSGNLVNSAGATGGYFGTPTLRFVGTAQSLNFKQADYTTLFGFEMASSSSLTIEGKIRFSSGASLKHLSGSVSADTTSLRFESLAGSTFIDVGSIEFGDMEFSGRDVNIIGSPLTLRGSLTLSANNTTARALTGSLNVYGHLVVTGNGMTGNGAVSLLGNSSSMTHTASEFPTGILTINKSAGQVLTLGSSVTLNAGQNVNVTGGQIDLASAANEFTIPGSLNLAATTSVKLSGGSLVVNGSSVVVGTYGSGMIQP